MSIKFFNCLLKRASASKIRRVLFAAIVIILFGLQALPAQQYSKARVWNEVVLHSIRNDFARPTVHARNLYHTSIAMYDAFAAYDDANETYFLGKTIGNYTCDFEGVEIPYDVQGAREMAMSYAVYRIIHHRFKNSPKTEDILFNADLIMSASGYDITYLDSDYRNGSPASLGNYIAEEIIKFGLQDGANEANDFANKQYQPVNPEMQPFLTFSDPFAPEINPPLNDPNRWQKLEIPNFTDQSGNVVENGSPDFLSPEWGRVTPFAMTDTDLTIKERDNGEWWIYHDPGPPCYLDTLVGGDLSDDYKWGFTMVANWKAHLILDTTIMMDISPASIGNQTNFSTSIADLRNFYDFENGGDFSKGHALNPYTNQPYEPQLVPRADYTRVLAEWWADGPSSETPPGHWFTILNYVSDRDELERKYKGQGGEMGKLEWDVKAYLTLGGAMHDAAISAWSIKGFYDYIRPISAIRYMIEQGQCSDPDAPNYNKNGIPLIPGFIEQIKEGDRTLQLDQSNLGDIKVYFGTFTGIRYWYEGKYWLPYQDISFVTPPFAGYVSGHSTYSRAAAEVLSLFTGDDFFPGGMGEFAIEENELRIEDAPSRPLRLQWATYRDAANQSGLSRIWGGIHPPVDDMPGRRIGEKVGIAAFELADQYFGASLSTNVPAANKLQESLTISPNPAKNNNTVIRLHSALLSGKDARITIYDQQGTLVFQKTTAANNEAIFKLDLSANTLAPGVYHLTVQSTKGDASEKLIILK